MKAHTAKRAFTLTELLVVLAIIALLAAILFPVLARVKEKSRQANCMTNMHQINTAASLYKLDNNKYPCMLLGFAERPDTFPYSSENEGLPVPAAQIKRGYLYPSYLNNIETFHCPTNPVEDRQKAVIAHFSDVSPMSKRLRERFSHPCPSFGTGNCFQHLPKQYHKQYIAMYAYDSYDITAMLDRDGLKQRRDAQGRDQYEYVYALDWTGVGMDESRKARIEDAPNQLQYPNMPPDKTVLTWCTYHAARGGMGMCPAIFASGTAKMVPINEMLTFGWDIAGGSEMARK